MSIMPFGYPVIMAPHRDWTRRGVGRALLWWPFTAFVLTAAFPAVAVPAVVGAGVLLVLVGLVGGAIGRARRARRLRRAGRSPGAIPRAVVEGSDAGSTGEPDTRAA